MLCPNCLEETERFEAEAPLREHPGYKCPHCRQPVPERYVNDYQAYPPVPLVLTALPGHGKGAFIGRLFAEFDRVGEDWPDFYYTPVQERFLENARTAQRSVEAGDVLPALRRYFPAPAVVKLDGVPEMGGCQLLLYDAPAESEPQPEELRFLSGYFGRNGVVALLASLPDLDSPNELTDFLTRFSETAARYGGETGSKTLVVALTKGDRLLGMDDLPPELKAAVLGQEFTVPEGETSDGFLSGIMEAWLGRRRETMNFVRRAKGEFRRVLYTVTVSGGTALAEGEPLRDVKPNIWQPLLAVWREQLELRRETQRRRVREKLGRVAKESVGEMSRRVLGALLGLLEGAVWGGVLWSGVPVMAALAAERVHPALAALGAGAVPAGVIWGALLWMLAGISDAAKGGGAFMRNGARTGVIAGLVLNGILAGLVWGVGGVILGLLEGGGSFAPAAAAEYFLQGASLGSVTGAPLGALWGFVVRLSHRVEIRSIAGLSWALLLGAIAAFLADRFGGLTFHLLLAVWAAVAVLAFALWASLQRN